MTTTTHEMPPEITARIRRLDKIPPLSPVAQQIMDLRSQNTPNAKALARIIELDPSLSAQVIRYACSALYAYKGKIDSTETAIARVLGYDMVINLALGIATTKPFKIPKDGPMGSDSFWRHAVYSAVMMQTLAAGLPREQRPSAGSAYLTGLLHDFGRLVFAHLFPEEYHQLNHIVAADPAADCTAVEETLIGTTHAELGAWLLKEWKLPNDVVVANLKHHDPDFQGTHACASHLVLITDRILDWNTTHGMTLDEETRPDPDLPSLSLEVLHVDQETVIRRAEKLLPKLPDMETMVQQLLV